MLGGLSTGIKAVSNALRWLENRGGTRPGRPAAPAARSASASPPAGAVPVSGPWPEAEARRLLASSGVPVVPGEVAGVRR